jgi:hypothetical protein
VQTPIGYTQHSNKIIFQTVDKAIRVPYIMDMRLQKPYVAKVVLTDDGGWHHIDVLNNYSLVIDTLFHGTQLPDYMEERIALLKLCDINLRKKGDKLGRRIGNGSLVVYLNYDEYIELKNLFKECEK